MADRGPFRGGFGLHARRGHGRARQRGDRPTRGFIGALYPFMDIAALVTAIVLARLSAERKAARAVQGVGSRDADHGRRIRPGRVAFDGEMIRGILVDTMRSPAISALILGLALGIFARPESVYESFYEPAFPGAPVDS